MYDEKDAREHLAMALDGKCLGRDAVIGLLEAPGGAALGICQSADALRQRLVGDVVTYVANRNINFTNVCTGSCLFCGYRREDGYTLSLDEVRAKVQTPGITEVCVQGGINPSLDASYYFSLLETIKDERPDIHIHAFSPEEVTHLASLMGTSVRQTLVELRRAGLGSMPGTAAEMLTDRVRALICPTKLSAASWEAVITTAHTLGIRTTATIMYGHVETQEERADHLLALRRIQERTGGFTEFIPLTYMPGNELGRRYGLAGATGCDDLLMYAVSRLAFGEAIPNIQASWVKLGRKMAQVSLFCGANDMGGTLYEERISRASGATHGESRSARDLEEMILSVGRTPRQRTTLYGRV